ncbi:MAG: ThiF family adenylyltransferase [Propionibacterium sp.]|nr:ThiF family adenylyltransferase [Propionibacterium sp.]
MAESALMSTAAAERTLSVALSSELDGRLRGHLARPDGQEDLTFALYQWSTGATRDTGLLVDLVPPEDGDRFIHGNASFAAQYFLRAAGIAAHRDCGLALLHAHPGATSWQGLSAADHAAESGHARQAQVLTGQPLLGLTYASGDGTYSARLWPVDDVPPGTAPAPRWARTVRSVGSRIQLSSNPAFAAPSSANSRTIRTVHAWGPATHDQLTRLRVGVIGAGSVAQLVAEGLARTGFSNITLVDFDSIEEHNLDRLLHATTADIGRAKVAVLAERLSRDAVADSLTVTALESSVVEADGWLEALDCDVLFSCVDRPWPRFALNVAAYAHLIPVVDGGVAVDVRDPGSDHPYLRGAEWRTHMVAPGRKCLECLGQYDPADVSLERAGLLDDESYIRSLPPGHRLRQRENVFAFSMACAAAELLELFRAVAQPSAIPDVGAALTHWATSTTRLDTGDCAARCPFQHDLLATGDRAQVDVTGAHPAAERARASRAHVPAPHQLRWARLLHRRWRAHA